MSNTREIDRSRLSLQFATSEGMNMGAWVSFLTGIVLPAFDRYAGQKYSEIPWTLTDYLRPQPTDIIVGVGAVLAVLLAVKAQQTYRSAAIEAAHMGLSWNGDRLVPLNPQGNTSQNGLA